MRTVFIAALLAPWAAACASSAGPSAAPPAIEAAAAARPPNDVHWARTAAEHSALFEQVYRSAADRLEELVRGPNPGEWAVVLDADETLLDNSEYQLMLARTGARYSEDTWNAWVRRVEADALPGAARFVARVRSLGGRAVIVTNRDEAVCDATRENLTRLAIVVDAVLCKPPGPSDKNPRFRAIERGAAGLPPLRVVMYVGDNIRDFPDQSQQLRDAQPGAFEPFGSTWFLLPNPMYGSWENNPPR